MFLLPAFTSLGQECQDLLSLQWNACVQTRLRFILSSERFLGNGFKIHVNSREKSPLPEAHRRVQPPMRAASYPRLTEGFNPQCCIMQDSEPNTLPTELFPPQSKGQTEHFRNHWYLTISIALSHTQQSNKDSK